MRRWPFVVVFAALLSLSALSRAEECGITQGQDLGADAAKAEHTGGSLPDKYLSAGAWQRGHAAGTDRPSGSILPMMAGNAAHYYDAQGNEVSEPEFKEIVKKRHEPSSKTKERRKPADTTSPEIREKRGVLLPKAKDAPELLDTTPYGIEVETKKHFLWSLETKKNTIYFLGSVHMLTGDSYPLAQEIEKAYDDSERIVFETDLDGLNDPMQQGKMMMLGLYPLGQTLQQNLSEKTYATLKERVAAAGMSMAAFDQLRPWLCALTLAVMELQRLGFDPNLGLDSHFFNKAKADGKERVFLEPVEYQLDLFANMDEGEQESFLGQTLEEIDVLETMALDMVRAWKTGDVEKLYSIFSGSFEGHPDIYNRLVIERNRAWVLKIENMMHQDGNVLVIVGAGHMVGKENILELLEKKGHRITQSASGPETAKVFDEKPLPSLHLANFPKKTRYREPFVHATSG